MEDTSNFLAKDPSMTRRKVLGRLGTFAAIAYAVPAVTTLSAVQASSGPSKSGGSNKSGSSHNSGSSHGSDHSEDDSDSSTPSTSNDDSNDDDDNNNGSNPGNDPAFQACGREDLTDPTYLQCLKDNNFPLPK